MLPRHSPTHHPLPKEFVPLNLLCRATACVRTRTRAYRQQLIVLVIVWMKAIEREWARILTLRDREMKTD